MTSQFVKYWAGIKNSLVLLTITLLVGCSQMNDSGVTKALNTDALLLTAGKAQSIKLGATSSGESNRGHAVHSDRQFVATIASGTPGQLLAAYRGEVKKQIEAMGGKIHGHGLSGTETDARSFSYDYSWGVNEGIVNVQSFIGTNSQIEITLFCYEHRR